MTKLIGDTSPQLSARRQGEALGIRLTNALHAALKESRPWNACPSLGSCYADDAVCTLDARKAEGFTRIALLLDAVGLIGSSWSDVRIDVNYVPGRINVIVDAVVRRHNNSMARCLQVLEFRSKHTRYSIQCESLIVVDTMATWVRRNNDVPTAKCDVDTDAD